MELQQSNLDRMHELASACCGFSKNGTYASGFNVCSFTVLMTCCFIDNRDRSFDDVLFHRQSRSKF